MSNKYFFKDSRTIYSCKTCKTLFAKGQSNRLGYCRPCRNKWRRQYKKDHPEIYATPEYKAKMYKDWLAWCKRDVKNFMRRRELALRSYHARKNDPKNKARKHRATRKNPA